MAAVNLNRSPSDGTYYEARRRSSVSAVLQEYNKQIRGLKDEDWKIVQGAITRLFQLKTLPEFSPELPDLHERLSKVAESDIGQFISEFYQEHVLKKCMIILRHDLKGAKGSELLEKLAETWTQFFTHILPTLEAIFVPTQICIRSVTLLSFRDHVLLKTPISEALDSGEQGDVPPRIKQMLLVLQGVMESPTTERFSQLVQIVPKAVQPYICLTSPLPPPHDPPFKP